MSKISSENSFLAKLFGSILTETLIFSKKFFSISSKSLQTWLKIKEKNWNSKLSFFIISNFLANILSVLKKAKASKEIILNYKTPHEVFFFNF